MNKWKIAVYLRLSKDDGDKSESNSIGNQKSLIENYLKDFKDIKIKDYYIDDGFSGTNFDRPDFQRMIEDVTDKKVNAVIVKDLSRFGRNYIEVGKYIEDIFPVFKLRFISINDNIDSFLKPDSIHNITVPVKNLMNDEYARDISNKVKSVVTNKKKNGEYIAPYEVYGYKKDPNRKNKILIDNEPAKIVRKIFKFILEGKSKAEVLCYLNDNKILTPSAYRNNIIKNKKKISTKWNVDALDRILRNEVYVGTLVQAKTRVISYKIHKQINNDEEDYIIVRNSHKAIISKEDYDLVQDILYSRDMKPKKDNTYDLFAGHLKCADCGNSMRTKLSSKNSNYNYRYYHCSSYDRQHICSLHSIRSDVLENIVLKIINTQINLFVDINKKITELINNNNINFDFEILNNQLLEIDNNLSKLDVLVNSLKNDLSSNFITEEEYVLYSQDYASKSSNLEIERKKIQDELGSLTFNSSKYLEWLNKFKEKFIIEKLDRKIINELIDYIYVEEGGNVKINFKFQDEFETIINFLKLHNSMI